MLAGLEMRRQSVRSAGGERRPLHTGPHFNPDPLTGFVGQSAPGLATVVKGVALRGVGLPVGPALPGATGRGGGRRRRRVGTGGPEWLGGGLRAGRREP
jgi:hypothetical protein